MAIVGTAGYFCTFHWLRNSLLSFFILLFSFSRLFSCCSFFFFSPSCAPFSRIWLYPSVLNFAPGVSWTARTVWWSAWTRVAPRGYQSSGDDADQLTEMLRSPGCERPVTAVNNLHVQLDFPVVNITNLITIIMTVHRRRMCAQRRGIAASERGYFLLKEYCQLHEYNITANKTREAIKSWDITSRKVGESP